MHSSDGLSCGVDLYNEAKADTELSTKTAPLLVPVVNYYAFLFLQ